MSMDNQDKFPDDEEKSESKNENQLITVPPLRKKINSRKLLNEQVSNMREPYLRPGTELANRRILSPNAKDEVIKTFGELSYRIIRKVDNSLVIDNNSVIMVTSIVPKGGNSLVALNLATSISSYESKMSLLIDCGLTGPSGYDHLITNNEKKGLSDYLLSSDMVEDEIIYPVGIPKVRLIPSGTKKIQGEYYGSVKMLELIYNVKYRYLESYIIIDAPAINESVHTELLAELSDYVLVVVPYGKVTPKDLINTANIIGEEKLLGFVFNNKPRIKIF
jgi:Mrp family chromosome partitioning ATPase